MSREAPQVCESCGGRGIVANSHTTASGEVIEWDSHCPDCDDLVPREQPTNPEPDDE